MESKELLNRSIFVRNSLYNLLRYKASQISSNGWKFSFTYISEFSAEFQNIFKLLLVFAERFS